MILTILGVQIRMADKSESLEISLAESEIENSLNSDWSGSLSEKAAYRNFRGKDINRECSSW